MTDLASLHTLLEPRRSDQAELTNTQTESSAQCNSRKDMQIGRQKKYRKNLHQNTQTLQIALNTTDSYKTTDVSMGHSTWQA